jgi:Holliday junction resolvase RusA-like endonuclease
VGKKKKKAGKASYDFEVAILGMIPASEKERSDGNVKQAVKRYQAALKEIARREVEQTGFTMLEEKERVVVTIIQFMGSQSDFTEGHDVDNFAKTVLDPLEGIVYQKDSQVQILLASKIHMNGYADIAYVGVHRIPTGTTFDELLKCANIENAMRLCDEAPKDMQDVIESLEELNLPNDLSG